MHPLINKGPTGAENISDGFLIDITSSIRRLDVKTFRMETVKKSKKPVEKTNDTNPMNTATPPIIKEALI